MISRISAIGLLGAAVAACTTDSGPREVGGTLVGAGTGALLGNAIGGAAGNRVAGTLAGAAIGGLIGNRIGAAMDDEDKRRAYAAQVQALGGAIRRAGGLAQSGLRPLWLGGARPGLPAAGRSVPAIHPHHLYRRPATRPRAAPPAAIRTAPGRRCSAKPLTSFPASAVQREAMHRRRGPFRRP
jgi:outer membrane lipoprotein SlyB